MHASDWIALVALTVSILALVGTRWRDRRQLLIRLHERLVDAELAGGRRLLFDAVRRGEADWWVTMPPADRDAVNTALAFMDIFGYYAAKKFVDERAALDLWAPAIMRAWDAAEPYVVYRS